MLTIQYMFCIKFTFFTEHSITYALSVTLLPSSLLRNIVSSMHQ